MLDPHVTYFSSQSSYIGNDSIQLPSIFHLNLHLEYNYSKLLSAYLELNNVTNSKKEFWRDYASIGFNGVFGINYSF